MRKAKYQGKDAYLAASASISSVASSARSFYDKASASASSAAAKYAAQATDYAFRTKDEMFDAAVDTWSESRLKAYLDDRSVPIPQTGKIEQLRALVRYNAHKAKVHAGFSDSFFDTWSTEQLKEFLETKAKGTRDELIAQAQRHYASASAKGGEVWKSVTARGAKATGYLFDQWSDSDLKSFLDSYGVPVTQDSKRTELIAAARKHSRYFSQGPDWYNLGFIRQFQAYVEERLGYIKDFISGASGDPYNVAEKVGDAAKESATIGKFPAQEVTKKVGDRADEKGQQAYDKIKEEL
jgi:AcrR family transcriptional regulator